MEEADQRGESYNATVDDEAWCTRIAGIAHRRSRADGLSLSEGLTAAVSSRLGKAARGE